MKTIVVGAGLSGLAAAHRLSRAGHEVHVLEADQRPGGRCATLRRDGFIIDTGPEIVAGSYRNYLKLVEEIGLSNKIVPSSPIVGTVRNGRVVDNDTTKPLAMMFTSLLSWRAKLRFATGLRKIWSVVSSVDAYGMADFPQHDDPTVTAEQNSRELFGTEVSEYLIDPLIRMIAGGHPSRISQLMLLGGLNSWSSALCNVLDGLDTVPLTLAKSLNVEYGARVQDVRASANGVSATYVDRSGAQRVLHADHCVLACRLEDAAQLSTYIAAVTSSYLAALAPARLIDIKVAYSAPTSSKAFACQMPSVEDRALLMYGLTHNKAPDRAPRDHSLFTLYTDDGVFDEFAPKSDEELISWARHAMERLYPEVAGHFMFGHVGRYGRAGYLATPGYFRRTAELLKALPADARIHIGGDVFGAGSMEAAVLWGNRAADHIIAATKHQAR